MQNPLDAIAEKDKCKVTISGNLKSQIETSRLKEHFDKMSIDKQVFRKVNIRSEK